VETVSVNLVRTASFAQALLGWAAQDGRKHLPWQPTPMQPGDPYRIWVSEIMLQQTQVKTMLPYFERFMARFPTVAELASAEVDEVLSHWSGLGYYARARNLHGAAQQIVAAGRWPASRVQWEALPGVGRSTAAAVVSIAWGHREAILDGNVRRVLARQIRAPQPWASAALSAQLWPVAEVLLPQSEQAMPAYTQALMDLGALVCLPRRPRCDACPVSQTCEAYRHDEVLAYPVPAVRRSRPTRTEHWALVVDDGAVLLEARPPRGIWGGLWTFPILSQPPTEGECWGHLNHAFTHFELFAQVWKVTRTALQTEGFWVELERARAGPLPSPVRRVLDAL